MSPFLVNSLNLIVKTKSLSIGWFGFCIDLKREFQKQKRWWVVHTNRNTRRYFFNFFSNRSIMNYIVRHFIHLFLCFFFWVFFLVFFLKKMLLFVCLLLCHCWLLLMLMHFRIDFTIRNRQFKVKDMWRIGGWHVGHNCTESHAGEWGIFLKDQLTLINNGWNINSSGI